MMHILHVNHDAQRIFVVFVAAMKPSKDVLVANSCSKCSINDTNCSTCIMPVGSMVSVRELSGKLLFQMTLQKSYVKESFCCGVLMIIMKKYKLPEQLGSIVWTVKKNNEGQRSELQVIIYEGMLILRRMNTEERESLTVLREPVIEGDNVRYLVENACFICTMPCRNADEDGTRDHNCQRCYPCNLCNECRLYVKDSPVCLWCLEDSELDQLSEEKRIRYKAVAEFIDSDDDQDKIDETLNLRKPKPVGFIF